MTVAGGLDPELLLAGPRGRRMLAELICAARVRGWHASQPAQAGVSPVMIAFPAGTSDAERAVELARARMPRAREDLAADVAALARAGGDVPPEPAALVDAVRVSVSANMPWQEPDGDDALLADPLIVQSLRPVAERIAASPSAGSWTRPLDLARQRLNLNPGWADEPPVVQDTDVTVMVTGLAAWAQLWRESTERAERRAQIDRPTDVAAPISGDWWSTPLAWVDPEAPGARHAPTTTPPLLGLDHPLGSTEMVWQEDDGGWEDTLLVPVAPVRPPRVHEVTGPSAWADLVRRFPLEVSASRRHDWYRHTGRDGAWAIPDWLAVREEFDAVHVTVAGYLTTAGRAVDVGDGVASVLAGWSPDSTAWLTDILVESGPRERWRRDSSLPGELEHGWRRA